jgi:uncharacterized damage-inducible protein DinB
MTDPTYDGLPRVAGERETLLAFIAWQRATLQRKCDGLTDTQLRTRSAPPSSLSLLGLVRHVAEVERSWFRRTLGQTSVDYLYSSDSDPDADFDHVDTADVADTFANWRDECAHADRLIAAHDLDDVVKQRTGREVSLRWILTHVVEEYSRHNGHADILRERIDGATGYG